MCILHVFFLFGFHGFSLLKHCLSSKVFWLGNACINAESLGCFEWCLWVLHENTQELDSSMMWKFSMPLLLTSVCVCYSLEAVWWDEAPSSSRLSVDIAGEHCFHPNVIWRCGHPATQPSHHLHSSFGFCESPVPLDQGFVRMILFCNVIHTFWDWVVWSGYMTWF